MNAKTKQRKNQVNSVNIFEQEELVKKADAIRRELQAHTWHDLETTGNSIRMQSCPSSAMTCL